MTDNRQIEEVALEYAVDEVEDLIEKVSHIESELDRILQWSERGDYNEKLLPFSDILREMMQDMGRRCKQLTEIKGKIK